jgi:hypothetical protein
MKIIKKNECQSVKTLEILKRKYASFDYQISESIPLIKTLEEIVCNKLKEIVKDYYLQYGWEYKEGWETINKVAEQEPQVKLLLDILDKMNQYKNFRDGRGEYLNSFPIYYYN